MSDSNMPEHIKRALGIKSENVLYNEYINKEKMTPLEKKFLEVIKKETSAFHHQSFTNTSKFVLGKEQGALSCASLAVEMMIKWDIWKKENGWELDEWIDSRKKNQVIYSKGLIVKEKDQLIQEFLKTLNKEE